MVRNDVLRCLEPVCGDLVQHLALEGDGAEDAVEGGDAVGRDEGAAAAWQQVTVAHLAADSLADGEVRSAERVVQFKFDSGV